MPVQKYDINTELLEEFDLESFIKQYKNVSANNFILNTKIKFSVNNYLLAEQIKLNNKLAYKIPTFQSKNCWITSKSFEQASGEKPALYKASLFSGHKLLDICGGLGVDDWAFSFRFNSILSLDIDPTLNALVNCNYKKLKINNVQRITTNAYSYLENNIEKFDLIYIDSDRRINDKKAFRLDDIEPSYSKIEPQLRKLTTYVLLKLSPLIDISYCVKNISNVKKIHVVAQDGEVKEVLCEIDYATNTPEKEIHIIAVDISSNKQTQFDAGFGIDEDHRLVNDEIIENYFYEASSAIVKARLCNHYGKSLHVHSVFKHGSYFVSERKLEDFMGRGFQIINAFEFGKKTIIDYLKQNNITRANVSRSNFPITPVEIKKQFQILDGGDEYLFFTTNAKGNKLFLHCRKIDWSNSK